MACLKSLVQKSHSLLLFLAQQASTPRPQPARPIGAFPLQAGPCTYAWAATPMPTTPRLAVRAWTGIQARCARPPWQLPRNKAATPAVGAARPDNYGEIRPAPPWPVQSLPFSILSLRRPQPFSLVGRAAPAPKASRRFSPICLTRPSLVL